MNILYSVYVKRIAVLELLFVASGFGLRAAFGGAATDTELTAVFLFRDFVLFDFLGRVQKAF